MPELFDKLTFKHIYFRGETFTPEMVQPAVDELAAYLEANRVSDSPFVFLFAHNHIKMVIAYFAIIKAGMIVVPLHPEIKPLELDDLLRDSDPTALIRIDRASLAFDCGEEIEFRKPSQPFESDDDLTDVCTMVYTAAEYGYYKGAMLTRDNIRANAQAVMDCDEITTENVSCALIPFHHLYAFQTGVLGPLTAGCSLLIEDLSDLRRFDGIVTDIQKCRVTNIYSLPTVYHLLAKVDNIREATKSVISLISGGIKLSPRVLERFHKRTGLEIHEGYGLTEGSPICTWHRPRDVIKLDSVGRAFSCCETCIMHENDDHQLSTGNIGELCIRGDNVMKGYYRHPETTARVLRGGWLRTGDLGKMDEDSYVYLTGLKKKMLNVGGLNVYPAELERLIKLNDNVKDVEVYGEESALGGHTVRARVQLRTGHSNGQKALSDWCAAQVSRFKIPKRFEFV